MREQEHDATSAEASSDTLAAGGARSFASFLRSEDAAAAPHVDDTGEVREEMAGEANASVTADVVDPVSESFDIADEASTATLMTKESNGVDVTTAVAETVEPPVAATTQPAASTSPPTPSFTRTAARPPTALRTARWQWVALLVLSLILVLQVLIADRAKLAADPGWRPLITRMCATLGCSVPAWHQPGAFTMLNRNVSPMPGTGALQVQATFRNDARWAQRWPVLVLSLSDADGRTVGSRAFNPREYLGASTTQTELGAGQSAQIGLQLHEPNPDVVAFAFDFR